MAGPMLAEPGASHPWPYGCDEGRGTLGKAPLLIPRGPRASTMPGTAGGSHRMNLNELQPETVLVESTTQTLTYRRKSGELVSVHVLSRKHFQTCWAIAVVQHTKSDDDGITRWQGMTQDQFNALAKELGWGEYDGFKPVWSYMTSGRAASRGHVAAQISVDGKDPDDEAGLAQELFQRVGFGGYVFGAVQELGDNERRLWKVLLPSPAEQARTWQDREHDANGADEYESLRRSVSRLLLLNGSDRFQYLIDAERLLETAEGVDPDWFRPSGPLAVDFERGTVCPRAPALEQIKRLTLSHPVSLLRGVSASGKTVLARHLALDLCRARQYPVFYLPYRPFEPGILAREINGQRGVFILEDVHRSVADFQVLCAKVRHSDPQRHVLLTAQLPLRGNDAKDWPDLWRMPFVTLHARDAVQNIITHYARNGPAPHLPWSSIDRHAIASSARHDLWLLANTLQGYVAHEARGSPEDWRRAPILGRLQALRAKCREAPSVVLAVAALYRREIPMAEEFLVEALRFEPSSLDALVGEREITREIDPSCRAYYGLHHASRAAAYWQYRNEYEHRADIPTDELEYLFQYVASAASNGIRALMQHGHEIRQRVRARLVAGSELLRAAKAERSTTAIGQLLHDMTPSEAEQSMRTAIAEELYCRPEFDHFLGGPGGRLDLTRLAEAFCDLGSTSTGSARKLWSTLRTEISDGTVRDIQLDELPTFIAALNAAVPGAGADFIGLLDKEDLLRQLADCPPMSRAWHAVIAMHKLDATLRHCGWALDELAAKLEQGEDVDSLWSFLDQARAVDVDVARDLCRRLSLEQVVRQCRGKGDNWHWLVRILRTWCGLDQPRSQRLWESLYDRAWARALSVERDYGHVLEVYRDIRRLEPAWAQQLSRDLDVSLLAIGLKLARNREYVERFMDVLKDGETGRERDLSRELRR